MNPDVSQTRSSDYRTIISCEQLAAELGRNAWRIIDCRFSLASTTQGKEAYAAAHIPGTLYAHLDNDLSGPIITGKTSRHPLPAIDTFVETLSGWGIDSQVQVVAYDDGPGTIASRLWWMLRWLGHDAVAVLDGGWQAWQAAGLPEELTTPDIPQRRFVPALRRELLLDAAGVEAILNDDQFALLDSRAAARYRGEVEPLDPVAGHIPSAISVPFTANLDDKNCLVPVEELQKRFAGLTDPENPEKTIFYCGSGVSACQNLLAWHHAGLGEARLYAGSWSEWITDPKRPVATGDSPA